MGFYTTSSAMWYNCRVLLLLSNCYTVYYCIIATICNLNIMNYLIIHISNNAMLNVFQNPGYSCKKIDNLLRSKNLKSNLFMK